ncbi:demethylmenaquinone methyltransferase [Mobilicoccus pelagius]|uniref:Demethylmenaquinone methyltransferase n=1 Tax=Mobilicoccus pelagius NBRC 104925 TaxID=1089455 RepID=H5UQD5_9MICO|nr:demethylmenaquinone methyltransferase [Mobilicoccus pelagius]GAB47943.1 demethylmenaquinone methyltransferase [Mobilicoccus pelagius NBRC 104925]
MMRAGLDKEPSDVARMFDAVAARYDLTNDVMTAGLVRSWRKVVTEAVDAGPGEVVLDIAAGTGTSSLPFREAGAHVISADFSLGMLREGKRRYTDLDFVAADATSLPLADASVDVVTMSYGLRNVREYAAALAEFRRVTRPGGRLVICEFSAPVQPMFREVYTRYIMGSLPTIARAVSSDPESYVYLAESIRDWPDQDRLATTIGGAGWRGVEWRNLLGGIVAIHRAYA